MNRIIKFRAWDASIKEFVKDKNCIGHFDDLYFGDLREIMNDSALQFQQFTGLLDKNGKEIYEGDIVKKYDEVEEKTYIGKIEFIADNFTCEFVIVCETERSFYDEMGIKFTWDELEIIGNIHENPTLLQ